MSHRAKKTRSRSLRIPVPVGILSEFLNMSNSTVTWLQRNGQIPLSQRNPSTPLVARIAANNTSLVVKQHQVRRLFDIESANLTFLSRVVPLSVPRVLYRNRQTCVLLLEDAGDVCPDPSDKDHNSQDVALMWKKILHSIAEIHHLTCVTPRLRREVYSGDLPNRPLLTPNRLGSALHEGCLELFCRKSLGRTTRRTLVHGLGEISNVLEKYRTRFKPYVIGERSSRNIRLLGNRIVHIDHSALPGFIPPADLVSIWRSRWRESLISAYVERRKDLRRNFDAEAFLRCDNAFTIYGCVLWCGLYMRTLHDLKARLPSIKESPLCPILENLSIAARSAQYLRMANLADALAFLSDSAREREAFQPHR
jgi:hypothetical protein